MAGERDPELDPEFDDTAPQRQSRSRIRSEAVAYADLAEQLVRSKRVELPMPPFDEDIRDALLAARRMVKSARSRQIRYLAQLLRGTGPISDLHDALEGRTAEAVAEQAREHGNESWRTRLLEHGDEALTQLIAAHPGADRSRLRQLMRQAKRTPPDARSKRASTALLRLIRETRMLPGPPEEQPGVEAEDTAESAAAQTAEKGESEAQSEVENPAENPAESEAESE